MGVISIIQTNDELVVYRGGDFVISKHIHIHQPTLDEIAKYGADKYFSMVNMLVTTPQALKAQLWYEMNIDYTTISPYELFYTLIHMMFPKDSTNILFGKLDFTEFKPYKNENGDIVLKQEYEYVENGENLKDEICFDEYTYGLMVDYLCSSYDIQRDMKIPMNNTTKMILIEDAQEELIRNKDKKYHFPLKNLISSMVNSEGFKYNHSDVWDIKINVFMDSVKRIMKIKNAMLLLQSGYSGFGINLKEVNDKQIDWLGELS